MFNSGPEEVILQQSKGTYGYYDDLYISTKAPFVNKAPSKISLSTTDVYENLDAGISLTTLSTTDKDSTHFQAGSGTYSLIHLPKVTLAKALKEAEKLGGHLASITSTEEWDEVLFQIGEENLIEKNVLLGATDQDTEGRWNG